MKHGECRTHAADNVCNLQFPHVIAVNAVEGSVITHESHHYYKIIK